MKGKTRDLSDLSLKDLRDLQEEVGRQIQQRGQQDVVKAREKILAIAASVGLPVHELLGKKRVESGPVPARYRNPVDQSQQWSGRGRQPRWVKALVASGKNLDNAKN